MTDYPTDPAAYGLIIRRSGDGPVTAMNVLLNATGETVAVYDGDEAVDDLVRRAWQRERGNPYDNKLPTDASLIEEALWDAGLVEDDDAAGEAEAALDAMFGSDCSGLEAGVPGAWDDVGAMPNVIRPEIQAVLDETPDATDDDDEDEDARPILDRLAETQNNLYSVSEVLDRATFQTISDTQDALTDLVAALRGLLECAELNQDDMEGDTRMMIDNAGAVLARVEG